MASRKDLKKKVKYIADTLASLYFVECLTSKDEEIVKRLNKILSVRQDLVSRISHTEPNNAREYYRKLRADMKALIIEMSEKSGATEQA